MGRKLKGDALIAEMARSEPYTDPALRKAVLRLARKSPEFGKLLIAEVLDVRPIAKRFLSAEERGKWLDMAGISALAIAESIEQEVRIGERERQKDLDGSIPPELIRDEMEDVETRSIEIVEEIAELGRQTEKLVLAGQEALKKLSLLLR